MRSRIRLALLALLILPAFSYASPFSWKMAFLLYDKGRMQSLPFSRPLTLKDGNQFQLLVQPASDAWVDVLYEDTGGKVRVLYQGRLRGGQGLYLPNEKHNYDISPPSGTERLHVIVSAARQTTLEASFKNLPKGSAATLDELARLKTSLFSIAEAPEKPSPMGGAARALADAKVTEFSGSEVYVKTIRFEH